MITSSPLSSLSPEHLTDTSVPWFTGKEVLVLRFEISGGKPEQDSDFYIGGYVPSVMIKQRFYLHVLLRICLKIAKSCCPIFNF